MAAFFVCLAVALIVLIPILEFWVNGGKSKAPEAVQDEEVSAFSYPYSRDSITLNEHWPL